MKTKKPDIRMRLRLAAGLLLLAGLSTSIFIYLAAAEKNRDASSYYDSAYISRMEPTDSKMYRHDLELFGGSAIVLADDFRRWFESLWKGKMLAATLACMSVVISSALFFVANRIPSGPVADKTPKEGLNN